jgi:hypothetical protein
MAVAVYVLVAIVQKRLELKPSLYIHVTNLQRHTIRESIATSATYRCDHYTRDYLAIAIN